MISKYQVKYSAIISEIQFQPFVKVLIKCAFHSHFLVSYQIFSQLLIIIQWFNLINEILSWLCKYEFFVTPWRKILYWQKIHYRLQVEKFYCILMGEGFILLTRGYGFMGGVPPPFWHVKKMYFCLWYELETLQVVRLAFLV